MRRQAGPAWRRTLAVAAGLVLTSAPGVAAQCAMCGTAMGSRGGFARGFIISVLFLLSILALLTAAFVVLVWSRNRTLDVEGRTAGPQAMPRTGSSLS